MALALCSLVCIAGLNEAHLSLHLINMAGISETLVTTAKKQVDGTFKDAGITLAWDRPNGLELTVVLVDSGKSHLDPFGRGMKGLAIGSRGQGARRAYVFVDRIRDEAQRLFQSAIGSPGAFDPRALDREMTEGLILGLVIAHEAGHLLLPDNAHTATGIMASRIDNGALDRAFDGNLHFLPKQVEYIRMVLGVNPK
jgi:hypothetical protein